MIFKFRNTKKKITLILLLNLAFACGSAQDIIAQKMIDERLIEDYFLFDLGSSYNETLSILKEKNLKIDRKDNIIKFYPESDKFNIKYSILIFTDGLLTNIMAYIDEPVTYMEYFYNDLKKNINIEYTDNSKQTAVWTDNNATIELKMIKEDFSSKKIFLLQFYMNESKKEPLTENKLKGLEKNHFIDLSVMGGPSFAAWGGLGGFVGIGFGYQYKFSKYFAFGPGISGFLSMIWSSGYSYKDDEGGYHSYPGSINYTGSGGVLSACFMFGELDRYKIAFLLDVGGGWMFSVKMGILIKMITFKIGYTMTAMTYVHNLTFEMGVKINFRSKKKIN